MHGRGHSGSDLPASIVGMAIATIVLALDVRWSWCVLASHCVALCCVALANLQLLFFIWFWFLAF